MIDKKENFGRIALIRSRLLGVGLGFGLRVWGARFTTLRDAISRRQDSSRQHDASPASDGPLGAWLLAPSENILSSAVPFLILHSASFVSLFRSSCSYLFTDMPHTPSLVLL